MADFQSWKPDNLAKFCEESQAEIVRLNNRYAQTIRVLSELTVAFDTLSNECCKVAERQAAYRAAMEMLK